MADVELLQGKTFCYLFITLVVPKTFMNNLLSAWTPPTETFKTSQTLIWWVSQIVLRITPIRCCLNEEWIITCMRFKLLTWALMRCICTSYTIWRWEEGRHVVATAIHQLQWLYNKIITKTALSIKVNNPKFMPAQVEAQIQLRPIHQRRKHHYCLWHPGLDGELPLLDLISISVD